MTIPPTPTVRWKPGAREKLEAAQIEKVRRRQIVENHEVNGRLADYVQSRAFNLALGKTHVTCLGMLASGEMLHTRMRPASPAMHGLEKRGLVSHRPPEGDELEPPPFGDPPPDVWFLTTAGKLVVMLLIEAGLLPADVHEEMPPPPPDWVDPRPKVTL